MMEADDRIRQARDQDERIKRAREAAGLVEQARAEQAESDEKSSVSDCEFDYAVALDEAAADLFAAVDERDALRTRVAELETSLHQSKRSNDHEHELDRRTGLCNTYRWLRQHWQ